MNPFKLFSPSYLFDELPGYTFLYFWPLLIFFVLVFIGSFKVKSLINHLQHSREAREFLGGIPSRMREFALIGIVLAFFRNENIPWLAMRFWTVLLFLLATAYGIWVWRKYQKGFETTVMRRSQKAEEDKYLPKQKRKNKKKRR